MDLAEYKQRFGGRDDAAPGWDAIDTRLESVYGDQEPEHWGTIIKHWMGGNDPIDGISAFECETGGIPHLHFVTYGFSSLYYDEAAVGGELSRFGFEMTLRLASPLPPVEEPVWVCNLLQNLARYVFKSGKRFEVNHWVPANGPIRARSDTALVGLIFVPDPALKPVDSPHGRVDFLQAVGITERELSTLEERKRPPEEVVNRLRGDNPMMVTDLMRRDR